jgi:hypothetical protein
MAKKVDRRKFNGGVGNSGRKKLTEGEKKQTLSFYVKGKHIKTAREKIQPIIDRLNAKN